MKSNKVSAKHAKESGLARSEEFEQVFSTTVFSMAESWLNRRDWKVSRVMVIYLRNLFDRYPGVEAFPPFVRRFLKKFFPVGTS